MRSVIHCLLMLCLLATSANTFATPPQKIRLDDAKIISGLKEALEVSTGNAVTQTGKLDGFFKNLAIKILMPKKLQTLEKGLRIAGFGGQVDEFVLSMNRAAERAAPQAKKIFVSAVKDMTFDDARRILTGGDTAATDYFKAKTSANLTSAFRPIIENSLNDVGATKQYKDLLGRLPFGAQKFDLDQYVTDGAINGLFYVIGQEEKKIRKNPVARVSTILRDVFGRR